MKNIKYVVLKMSAGGKVVSKFSDRKLSEDYVIKQCCSLCKKEGLRSACAAEYLIIPYNKWIKCKTYEDIWEAGGYKTIKKSY